MIYGGFISSGQLHRELACELVNYTVQPLQNIGATVVVAYDLLHISQMLGEVVIVDQGRIVEDGLKRRGGRRLWCEGLVSWYSWW
jgi:ABC-type ATPase involved in cell division